MNIILFNGPPRSGKDTAAKMVYYDHFRRQYPNKLYPLWEKFSFPNKRAFAGMMGLGIDMLGYVDPWEDRKSDIVPSLGVSYRQWQIDYSEKFMKPLYGNDIFGRLFLDRVSHYNPKFFIPIVSDCGFQVEADILRDHNVLLFRMERDGCTFAGDSRQPVAPASNWAFYNVNNNVSKEEMGQFVIGRVDHWLAGIK